MALHFQSLAELEALCTHLYIGTDLTQRIEAEKALLELIDSPECLSKCQLLLEQGTTSYAQLLAATCLSKLVSRVSPLPVEQRIDIIPKNRGELLQLDKEHLPKNLWAEDCLENLSILSWSCVFKKAKEKSAI